MKSDDLSFETIETMKGPFDFSRQVLDCVVGGVSTLDSPRLNVHTLEEARQFILAYGYDMNDPATAEELWATHRRAVAMIREQLLDPGEEIPEVLVEPNQLKDLSQLLIFASADPQSSNDAEETRHLQRWACAILRVMHVYVHLRNDLFSAFRDEIQAQILSPLQDSIRHDEVGQVTVLGAAVAGSGAGAGSTNTGIQLSKFEIKPFKTTASSVIKLLARPERVALTLLDKLGVRFVTRTTYDAFRVIRFLVDQHMLSYPHIIPDQSNNTLYPVNLFLEAMDELKAKAASGREPTSEEIQEILKGHLQRSQTRAEYREKWNEFSGPDYRFIKFINRKLITVSVGSGEKARNFRFFYPFEIQVMDHETYEKNMSGPMAHSEYKKRQRLRARARVLGGLDETSEESRDV
jgi:uncharacterized protein (TIGR04562 family)